MADSVTTFLTGSGVQLIRPPEGDPLSVARYASMTRQLAVDLAWLDINKIHDVKNMISLPLEAPGFSTELAILRRRRDQRPATALFWDFASARQEK